MNHNEPQQLNALSRTTPTTHSVNFEGQKPYSPPQLTTYGRFNRLTLEVCSPNDLGCNEDEV